MSIRLAVTCLLALVVSGCATSSVTTQTYPDAPATAPNTQAVEVPAPATEPLIAAPQPVVTPPNPALVSLAKQARMQYLSQDYQAAIATAERGLRIDRRSADMYLLLAQCYVQLEQLPKAKMFLQQGLRYAPPGSEVLMSLMRVQDLVNQ